MKAAVIICLGLVVLAAAVFANDADEVVEVADADDAKKEEEVDNAPFCLSSAVNGADVCASASSEVEEEDVSYCCEDDSLYVMFKSEDNTCRCRTKEEFCDANPFAWTCFSY